MSGRPRLDLGRIVLILAGVLIALLVLHQLGLGDVVRGARDGYADGRTQPVVRSER